MFDEHSIRSKALRVHQREDLTIRENILQRQLDHCCQVDIDICLFMDHAMTAIAKSLSCE